MMNCCLGCSACHMRAPTPNWRRLLSHLTVLAAIRAFCRLGSRIAINNAMIPMTTNNSTSVKARRLKCVICGLLCGDLLRFLVLEFEFIGLVEHLFHLGSLHPHPADGAGALLGGPVRIIVRELETHPVLDRPQRRAADAGLRVGKHRKQMIEYLEVPDVGNAADRGNA